MRAERSLTRVHSLVGLLCLSNLLASCASSPITGHGAQRIAAGEATTLLGPSTRTNQTPLEHSMACFADHLAATQYGNTIIGVGEIKDYTGKYSINEGNAVTQGGSLMVYSALGKLGNVITIAERYDPSIAERELGYVDRRQLGDGQFHDVDGQKVRWLPYFGGSIARSDYYIVGGITELNYNISSGGVEAGVNGFGGKARVYNQSVAIDMRIVDTKTLLVLKTVSLTKQFTGQEVGFNIFRFFGSDLFDINVGSKAQEPLQLGIRATLEEATIRLVASVARIDPEPCLSLRTPRYPDKPAEKLYGKALDGRPILNPLVAAQRQVLEQRAQGIPATDEPLPGLVRNVPTVGAPAVTYEPRRLPLVSPTSKAGKERPAPPPPPPIPGSNAVQVASPPVAAAPAPVALASTQRSAPASPSPAPLARAPAPAKASAPAVSQMLNRVPTAGSGAAEDASAMQIQFEFGAVTIASASISAIDTIAARWQRGAVNVTLVARDIENLDPAKRDALIDQRLAILLFALERKGVPKTAVRITWRPARNDATIYRDGPGLQEIAKIRLEK